LIVVAAYIVVGVLYAIFTPLWQVPDEPAHYNYIRSLATGQGIPVLEPGDYDQALLSELTSRGFPAEMSIDPLEYEDHQPPLYYVLAVPVYRLFHGAVLPLRLFSIVLGAGILFAAYLAVQTVFPDRPEVSKTTAYPPLAAVFLVVVLRWRTERHATGWLLAQARWLLVPAFVISAPWFIRNGMTYGWGDPLGLVRHDTVVVGQPRSYDWLMLYGWRGMLSRLGQTTFHSFWGQFGWMGVILPSRIYQLLALISLGLLVGFVWWLFGPRRRSLSREQKVCLGAFLAAGILTVVAFVWYNLGFVQHQGRYLFPALVPLGLAVALSIDQWLSFLPRLVRPRVRSGTYGVLAILALFDIYCLFRFIVPALTK